MLGENKAVCYLLIGGIGTLALIPAMVCRIRDIIKGHCFTEHIPDIIVTSAMLLITLSFITAFDHSVSLFGIDGWRMGFVTYILIFAGYATECWYARH